MVATVPSGSGTVSVGGGITLVLTGANSYVGVTTVLNGSVLQIGNGGATGSVASSSIVNTGTVSFNRNNTITYGGTISGLGGTVSVIGGTLNFNTAQIYTGVTSIATGATLVLGGAGGAVAGSITDWNGSQNSVLVT